MADLAPETASGPDVSTSSPGVAELVLLREAAASIRDAWGGAWQAADPSAVFHLAVAQMLTGEADRLEECLSGWSGSLVLHPHHAARVVVPDAVPTSAESVAWHIDRNHGDALAVARAWLDQAD